jgi:LacI family transcriptional regulator
LFSESQQQKLKAFCNAFSLYKRSVPDESFIIKLYEDDDNHFNDGYNSTMQLLRQHPETTAIVYSSDCIAKGGLAAVKELGLKIPDDISIVSFDNSDWACSYTPAISSCAENSKNISDILLSNLFKKIESRNMKAEVVTEQVQMEFIPRESTGLAKR